MKEIYVRFAQLDAFAMPVSTIVSTGQYHSAVICAQRTRRAAPRMKGCSVRRISLVGLRSDASAFATFQMAANCAAAKQEPRCLAVDCTACASSGLYFCFEHCLWLSCFLLQ